MTPWQRLKNLWKLSDYPYITIEPTLEIQKLLADSEAVFIPRTKRDPIKELTNHE